MSTREVIRTTGDWHVQATQDLHLETQYLSGNNGTVYVYGNLMVKGNTTTIESTDLSIGDKVLVLNKGEPGIAGGTEAGVSVDGISGISISRGGPNDPAENANWFFNQNKTWSYDGTLTNGMWEAIIGPPTGGIGTHSGAILNAIRTGSANTDLSLLGAENASAVVTLSGVVNYTQRITSRANPDDVPNKGYVDYAIEAQPDRRRIQLNYRLVDFVPLDKEILKENIVYGKKDDLSFSYLSKIIDENLKVEKVKEKNSFFEKRIKIK
jgi:hypothetical protein